MRERKWSKSFSREISFSDLLIAYIIISVEKWRRNIKFNIQILYRKHKMIIYYIRRLDEHKP